VGRATLATDFDDTITREDTTPLLPRLAVERLPAKEASTLLARWERGARQYYARWQQAMEQALNSVLPALPPAARSSPVEAIVRFTSLLATVDRWSLDMVVRGGLLRGITREQLQRAGRDAPKRDGALETLARAEQQGVDVHVISANWSRDVVRSGLGRLRATVHSNDLDFDGNGVSTGVISRRIVSAQDKRAVFREARLGAAMFVGDGVSDLLALLDADVGILLAPKEPCLRVCEHLGVRVAALGAYAEAARGILYRADSWLDVGAFLDRWCAGV
jgi:phosphoserine phosphatase